MRQSLKLAAMRITKIVRRPKRRQRKILKRVAKQRRVITKKTVVQQKKKKKSRGVVTVAPISPPPPPPPPVVVSYLQGFLNLDNVGGYHNSALFHIREYGDGNTPSTKILVYDKRILCDNLEPLTHNLFYYLTSHIHELHWISRDKRIVLDANIFLELPNLTLLYLDECTTESLDVAIRYTRPVCKIYVKQAYYSISFDRVFRQSRVVIETLCLMSDTDPIISPFVGSKAVNKFTNVYELAYWRRQRSDDNFHLLVPKITEVILNYFPERLQLSPHVRIVEFAFNCSEFSKVLTEFNYKVKPFVHENVKHVIYNNILTKRMILLLKKMFPNADLTYTDDDSIYALNLYWQQYPHLREIKIEITEYVNVKYRVQAKRAIFGLNGSSPLIFKQFFRYLARQCHFETITFNTKDDVFYVIYLVNALKEVARQCNYTVLGPCVPSGTRDNVYLGIDYQNKRWYFSYMNPFAEIKPLLQFRKFT